MVVNSLAVFCGSREGKNPVYIQHAIEIGKILVSKNIRLIYGGGSVGIMGAIAATVLEGGGHVQGVIPKLLVDKEKQHNNLTELTVVDDMHMRKKHLYKLCDAALILPGGFGTMDELFEILTWNQLFIHNKPVFLLNSEGFYQHLIMHLNKLEAENFLYEKPAESLVILNNPQNLIEHLD